MHTSRSSFMTIRKLKIVKLKLALISNNHELIFSPEYFEGLKHPAVIEGEGWHIRSMLANFKIEDFQSDLPIDGYFYIFDLSGISPTISVNKEKVFAVGEWSKLEAEALDKRYSLLGNQGLLFRYILTLLERKYGIYNLHACALYNEASNNLILALGERGSGKSALLLALLNEGRFKLFASEIVHIGLEDGKVKFYKGTLRNNVRVGHLLEDFPEIAENIGVKFGSLDDPWGTKIQLDFGMYGVEKDEIVDPKVTLILPRIEEYNKLSLAKEITDTRRIKRALVENLSDKINSLPLIYEKVPIGSLDDAHLLSNRVKFVDNLLKCWRLERALSLFASPKNCLEGWLI